MMGIPDIINKIIRGILLMIFIFAIISVPIAMIKYNASYPEVFNFAECPYIVLGILFTLLWVWLYKHLVGLNKTRLVLIIGFVTANILSAYFIITCGTQPISDYEAIWNTAIQMADGSFKISNLHHYDYMMVYNWQLGISWIESLSVRLFGPTVLPLQILNIILLNMMLVLVYCLSRKIIASTKWQILPVSLLSIYYPVIVTIPQFTNQHLACVMILLVVYLLCFDKWYLWLLAGVFIALLNMVRPMGVILIITGICLTVTAILIKSDKRLSSLFYLVCLLLSCAVCTHAIDWGFERAGYADAPISKSKIPYFKFHKGLTGYDCPEVDKFSSIEEFNNWEKRQVKNALVQHPKVTLTYVFKKMIRYLGGFDYKVEMTYNKNESIWNSGWIKRFVMFGWGQYSAILLLCLMSVIVCKKDLYVTPVAIVFIGITLVYFFIEAFTSYRYESYPFMMIIASSGLNRVVKIN